MFLLFLKIFLDFLSLHLIEIWILKHLTHIWNPVVTLLIALFIRKVYVRIDLQYVTQFAQSIFLSFTIRLLFCISLKFECHFMLYAGFTEGSSCKLL